MITTRDELLAFATSSPELQAAFLAYIRAKAAHAVKHLTQTVKK